MSNLIMQMHKIITNNELHIEELRMLENLIFE